MLKILKSGNFGHPVIGKPAQAVKEGEVRGDIDGAMAQSMIDCGWAEREEEDKAEKQTTVEAPVEEEAGTEEVAEPVKKKRGRKSKK